MAKVSVTIEVNGESHEVLVKNSTTLLDLLREELLLTGTKKGCDSGECGACTVILDGKAVNACLVLAVDANFGKVETVEGLGGENAFHPLQEQFAQHGAIQCGYCTPGMLMSSKALIDRNPCPNDMDIKTALSGNLCRCGGYLQIIDAVKSTVKK